MAATRLIALHKNKGKTVAACLKSRTDYVQNPDKTEQGELVSCHECSPLTVDEEFMLGISQQAFCNAKFAFVRTNALLATMVLVLRSSQPVSYTDAQT